MSERCTIPNSDPSTSILDGNGQMARLGDSGLNAGGDQERRKIHSYCSNISDKHDGERRTFMEVLTDFPTVNQPLYIIRCKYLLEQNPTWNGFIVCNQCNSFRMQHGSYNRYDLALDHALSHIGRPIFPCLTCNTVCPTIAVLSYHLMKFHGTTNKNIFHFTHIMDQHCQEILNMLDQCFGPKTMPQERGRQISITMSRSNSYPVVLRRYDPPTQSESDKRDTVWNYLKSKLTATYTIGMFIRCSICHCQLGHQRIGDWSYKDISDAYVHMFTHTDIFPFVCTYCQHSGKSASAMAKHLKFAHPECAASIWASNFNAFTNNTLPYKTELMELVDRCFSKSGPISFKYQKGESSVMPTLRGHCQRTILEYLKPNCALDCSFCGEILSELWVSKPTTSKQSKMVALDGHTAFEHVLGHCHALWFTCRHCSLITQGYEYMKRHVQWIHQSDSIRGIHVVETASFYQEIEKMIDRCFRKSLNIPKEPAAKIRRLLETATMPNKVSNGVTSIPSTHQGLALDYVRSVSSADQASSENDHKSMIDPMTITNMIGSGISSDTSSSGSSLIVSGNGIGISSISTAHTPLAALEHGPSELSPDQAVLENDQESKMCPVTTRSIDSGISSEIASKSSSVTTGGNGNSGWTVVVKCEVVDSTPVLIPTDQCVLKKPKKEEPEYDG